MIFVTVGTTKYPFDRLIGTVDRVLVMMGIREKLVVQRGKSRKKIMYPRATVHDELEYGRMVEMIKKSRVIITAGGPATIYLVQRYGRNAPLVMPRSGSLGEHVDDHEILFGRFIERSGCLKVLFPDDDLEKEIAGFLEKPMINTRRRKLAVSPGLVNKLVNLTASYEK